MKGLSIPIRVSPAGGFALADGETKDRETINVALSGDDNENAFQQDIGLGSSMVFEISEPALRAQILRRLRTIFADFEAQKRYKLLTNTIVWFEDAAAQELALEFKYFNLETDEERVFRRTFSPET